MSAYIKYEEKYLKVVNKFIVNKGIINLIKWTRTICTAVIICANTIIISPSNGLEAEPALSSGSRTEAMPTIAVPVRTRIIPIQWNAYKRRPRNITEKIPVKSTTEPRSIWKTEREMSEK